MRHVTVYQTPLGCRCGLGRHIYCIEGVVVPDVVTDKWKKRNVGTMVCSLCSLDAQRTAVPSGETQTPSPSTRAPGPTVVGGHAHLAVT